MEKWLKRAGAVAATLIVLLATTVLLTEIDHQVLKKRTKNEELETIKKDWPGNALDSRDRFFDEQYPYLPSMLDVARWKLGGNPLEEARANDTWKAEVRDPSQFLASDRDGIMWLGHASFYIRIGGISILTDPVFGDTRFLKRLVPVPSQLDQIRRVDYVLLSHDHRDHMDEATLRAIALKFPNAAFTGGLRSEDVLHAWTTPTNRILTAGWFQKFATGDEKVGIHFLPVRHWSRRFLMDTNWRLWGSYIVQIGGKTIYFGGDSGYSEHFRTVGELFPTIDYFLVGIGAYEPNWFMRPNHATPDEAVQAFIDAKGGVLIPMHYGTFELSDEPPGEPLRRLGEAAQAANSSARMRPLAINETLLIDE
jgi:L-ascorbate metabolism protein UlaG (beta-lactamase superfamily)